MTEWRRLRGTQVRVTASGVEYRGIVVEMGEEALVLRSPTGMLEIPWDRVTHLEESPGG
ncbi:MAG: hypothetical protein SCH98_02250 [Deferrisomatales bacterium]|nr:hypothetical protein [Deferrisomatales bacterium]